MSELDEEPATISARRTLRLAWVDATGALRSFALEGRERVTIGRGSRADISIRDTRISRHHATIELVHGQHLLRDAGSANGTFLNGLRLTSGSAFALRPGDLIAVGGDRFTYESAGALATATDPLGRTRYALADLLADGAKELSVHERSALDVAVHRAVTMVSLDEGMKRILGLVAERLPLTSAAAFLEDQSGKLRVRAGRPFLGSATALHSFAVRAVESEEGCLLYGATPLDEAGSQDDTHVESNTSFAAVPFRACGGWGALAVHRAFGERLDVRSLALLATIGASVGRALT